MRGDRDEKAWAFESAVEKALWWMLRSTLGRALRLMLRLWWGSKIFRIMSYAGAGILVTAGIAFTSVRTYENRHASIHVGPGAYELSLRGDRFSTYTPKGIEVWNLDRRRRISGAHRGGHPDTAYGRWFGYTDDRHREGHRLARVEPGRRVDRGTYPGCHTGREGTRRASPSARTGGCSPRAEPR
jgi:hypothetical protein